MLKNWFFKRYHYEIALIRLQGWDAGYAARKHDEIVEKKMAKKPVKKPMKPGKGTRGC